MIKYKHKDIFNKIDKYDPENSINIINDEGQK